MIKEGFLFNAVMIGFGILFLSQLAILGYFMFKPDNRKKKSI
tara:strand:+ start:287926 stop:288051 length:126 start_codon:yes stop_codon:yes gene_type:complete